MRWVVAGAALSGLVCSLAAAQTPRLELRGNWSLGISVGASSFSGASAEITPSGEGVSFAPYRPTMWGLMLSYGRQGLRAGFAMRYGQPGVRIRGAPSPVPDEEGTPIVLIAENAYHLSTFTGLLSAPLTRLRSGPVLRGSFGLGVERWASPGAPIRTLGATQLGLAAEAALSRAWVAALEGELGWTPASPFRKDELPEGFRARSTWRRSLAGSLVWRF